MHHYPAPDTLGMASAETLEGQPDKSTIANIEENKTNFDDEKKEHIHQISTKQRNAFQIYRILPTKHAINTKTKQWVPIPGLTKTLKIENDYADVIITAHGHALASDNSRVDLGIFVDAQQIGINGTKSAPQWKDEYNGMGLTWSNKWIPLISISSCQLTKGIHTIYCAMRNGSDNNHLSRCNGAAMLIQLFQPINIMNEWIDIDLNDKITYFNKDLEYRVEMKGESFVYALKVSKKELWVFFNDQEMNIPPGFIKIDYNRKRCINNNYIVTKIQCSNRKVKQ